MIETLASSPSRVDGLEDPDVLLDRGHAPSRARGPPRRGRRWSPWRPAALRLADRRATASSRVSPADVAGGDPADDRAWARAGRVGDQQAIEHAHLGSGRLCWSGCAGRSAGDRWRAPASPRATGRPRLVDDPAHRLRARAGAADPPQARHARRPPASAFSSPARDLAQRLHVVPEVAAGAVGLGQVPRQVPEVGRRGRRRSRRRQPTIVKAGTPRRRKKSGCGSCRRSSRRTPSTVSPARMRSSGASASPWPRARDAGPQVAQVEVADQLRRPPRSTGCCASAFFIGLRP